MIEAYGGYIVIQDMTEDTGNKLITLPDNIRKVAAKGKVLSVGSLIKGKIAKNSIVLFRITRGLDISALYNGCKIICEEDILGIINDESN